MNFLYLKKKKKYDTFLQDKKKKKKKKKKKIVYVKIKIRKYCMLKLNFQGEKFIKS